MRVIIRSRLGRAVLTVLGVLYFVGASAILVYYLISNWGLNRLTDYVLQLALIGSAFAGLLFVLIGTDNMKAWRSGARPRSTPDHRKAAAAV